MVKEDIKMRTWVFKKSGITIKQVAYWTYEIWRYGLYLGDTYVSSNADKNNYEKDLDSGIYDTFSHDPTLLQRAREGKRRLLQCTTEHQ